MVQCYSCGNTLNGAWSLNYTGYNNGSYLGVDAYFAYNGTNWVYCFCGTCYGNGKFAQNIKNWYAGPINSIIAQEIKKTTKDFQQRLAGKQKQVQQLESKLKTYDILTKILSQESKCLIVKTEEYFKQLEKSLKITPKQFIDHLSLQVNSLIKKYSEESVKSLKLDLNQIKLQCEKDFQKLKSIEEQTLNTLKSAKNYSNQNLFEDQEIKDCETMFANKKKGKEERLKLIIQTIEHG